jgi:hypothetical protein
MKHTRKIRARYPQMKGGEYVVVSHFWLEECAAVAFEAMRDHLDTLCPGAVFCITDAGRTHAQQVALKAAKGKWAATPGRSWHEAGMAIDVYVEQVASTLRAILLRPVTPGCEAEVARLQSVYTTSGRQALLEAYLLSFGWKRTVRLEPWHFQYLPSMGVVKGSVTAGIAYIGNGA